MVTELILSGLLIAFGCIYGSYLYNRNSTISFPDISIILAVLYFGAGSWVSFIFGYRWENDYDSTLITILSFVGIYLFILGLVCSKFFPLKPIREGQFTHGGHRSSLFYFPVKVEGLKLIWILLSVFFIWILRFYDWSIGAGVSSTETFEVVMSKPYPIVIIDALFRPLNYVILMYAIMQIISPLRKNYLWLIYIAAEVGFMALQGRRDLFELCLLILFCYYSVYAKIRLKILVPISIFAVCIFTIFSPFFLIFRDVVRTESQGFREASIYQAISTAISDSKVADQVKLQERSENNIQGRSRSNIIWTKTVLSEQISKQPLMGEVAFSGAMSTLPRTLRPYKYWGDNAAVIQRNYGIGDGDVSDNFVANGIADFSLIGPFIYGLVIGLTLNFLFSRALCLAADNLLLAALLFVWIWNFSINTEISMTAYFALWRGVFILWLIGGVMSLMGINTGNRKISSTIVSRKQGLKHGA
jgi:hypothetical protein